MDQIKIGRFIAECRKKSNLTQLQLAEKLGITDKAISKWERGVAMPDTSIMLELCDILCITVNELLSGEKIDMENNNQKCEQLFQYFCGNNARKPCSYKHARGTAKADGEKHVCGHSAAKEDKGHGCTRGEEKKEKIQPLRFKLWHISHKKQIYHKKPSASNSHSAEYRK